MIRFKIIVIFGEGGTQAGEVRLVHLNMKSWSETVNNKPVVSGLINRSESRIC